jgi:hypothetical protein
MKRPPIVILTPGKVGSTSVEYTLKGEKKWNIFHIHNLNINTIRQIKESNLLTNRKSIPLHLIVSGILSNKLKKYKLPIYYITIVREPISREISSFFQNIDQVKDRVEGHRLDIDIEKSIELIQEKFHNNITSNLEVWFKTEIEEAMGIDIFKKEYDYKKDYEIFSNGQHNLLIMRMETMNQVFPLAIKDFLNLEAPLYLLNKNIGEKKYYSSDYSGIRARVRFRKKIIDNIIESKFFSHFYTDSKHKAKKYQKL